MKELIYQIIYYVARVHDQILSINDDGGYYFNDKQLHFQASGKVRAYYGDCMAVCIHPGAGYLLRY